jgi:hypothetical protein
LEGEDLNVHDVVNDSRDFCPKSVDIAIHCNIALPISALLVIGPPTSAFLISSLPINAHPSPPLSTIDLTFVAIDDSSIIVDDEYAPHEVLPKFRFLEEVLDNVNKGGHRAKKHLEVWAKKTFDEWQKI